MLRSHEGSVPTVYDRLRRKLSVLNYVNICCCQSARGVPEPNQRLGLCRATAKSDNVKFNFVRTDNVKFNFVRTASTTITHSTALVRWPGARSGHAAWVSPATGQMLVFGTYSLSSSHRATLSFSRSLAQHLLALSSPDILCFARV